MPGACVDTVEIFVLWLHGSARLAPVEQSRITRLIQAFGGYGVLEEVALPENAGEVCAAVILFAKACRNFAVALWIFMMDAERVVPEEEVSCYHVR